MHQKPEEKRLCALEHQRPAVSTGIAGGGRKGRIELGGRRARAKTHLRNTGPLSHVNCWGKWRGCVPTQPGKQNEFGGSGRWGGGGAGRVTGGWKEVDNEVSTQGDMQKRDFGGGEL